MHRTLEADMPGSTIMQKENLLATFTVKLFVKTVMMPPKILNITIRQLSNC